VGVVYIVQGDAMHSNEWFLFSIT